MKNEGDTGAMKGRGCLMLYNFITASHVCNDSDEKSDRLCTAPIKRWQNPERGFSQAYINAKILNLH